MRLAIDNEGIDAAPNVVDRGIADEAETATFRVNLDFANRAPIREHRIIHFIVGNNDKPVGQVIRHLMQRHFPCQLEKI